jgi:hypothetical protein
MSEEATLKTTTIVPNENGPSVVTKKTITAGARVNSSTQYDPPSPGPTADPQKTPLPAGADSTAKAGDNAEGGSEGEEPKKPEKVEDSQLSRLSKVERRIKEREAQVASQLQLLAQKEAKIKEAEEWLELPKRAKENPVEALAKLGIEFEDLAQAIINGGKPPEEKVQQNKIDELANKINAFEEQQAELRRNAQQESERAAAIDYVKMGHEYVTQNVDDFELIRAKGNSAWDDVWQLAEETFKQTGEVPDIKQVVKAIEDYYMSEAEASFKASKKLAKKLGLPDPTLAGMTPESKQLIEATAKAMNPKVSTKPVAPTLGGKMSQAVPGVVKPGEKLSDKEKLQRIIAWGNEQLAKKSG